MKKNTFTSGLLLASLLVAVSSTGSEAHITAGKSNQNEARKTEAPKRVYDISGKRFRVDEKYIAERTLKDGRIIGYRKNQREIAALIKALKDDGVTDEKLLDANAWMMIICQLSVSSGCNGGCGIAYSCKSVPGVVERKIDPNLPPPAHLHYCGCAKNQ